MGWLGWTEQQTLATTMPSIVLAYKGRGKMIRETINAVFGGSDSQPSGTPAAERKPISMEKIQSVFRTLAG